MNEKNSLRNDIGRYLKTARIHQSLTGAQLGQLLQVSQQQISRYEQGKTGLTIETLDKLLNILEKSWGDFFFTVMSDYSDDIREMKYREEMFK